MADNNNEVVYGTDLVLLVEITADNWQQVAHAQSHSIDLTRETYQVSSKSTGEWNLSRYGKISWSGSIDGLVIFDPTVFNYEQLADLQIARTPIKVVSVLNNPLNGTPLDDTKADYNPADTSTLVDNPFTEGTPYYVGEAVITSLNKVAAEADNTTFTMSFEGSTKLEKKVVATVV